MTRETVDQIIERMMREYPSDTTRGRLAFFEACHQEIAPLCRELESENKRLLAEGRQHWKAMRDTLRPRQRTVFTCPCCGNVYKAGEQDVTIYAENGHAKCRACNPRMTRPGHIMMTSLEDRS